MTQPASAVSVLGLTKRFGSTLAVDGLTFEVKRGGIFGLVGPDGAGKSTTIRLLTGTMRPSAGRAVVAGCDVASNPEGVRARVGYVAQHFALYGDLTVAENLAFFADIFGVPQVVRPRRTAELLAFSRLAEHSTRLADQLSGGMKRKLALACALIHRPEVLFLDEPTAGVDPLSRRELWQILGRLLGDGLTIVLSTAYMDEAERCHDLAFLSDGRLVASGAPDALRRLVADRIYEVRGQPLRLARALAQEMVGATAVRSLGDRLRVFARPGVHLADAFWERMREHGVGGLDVREVTPSMEDVFVTLRQSHGTSPLAGRDARDGPGGQA